MLLMGSWALDLGTTNTGVARWNDAEGAVELVELTEICRRPGTDDPLEAPRLVPSATHVVEKQSFWTRVGNWGLFSRRVFWGRLAHIGRQALELNEARIHPNYAATFKPYLAHEGLRPLVRVGKYRYTARDVARLFVRELFSEVKRQTGERIRDLVVTTPVESFESYRAEVMQIVKKLGVKRLRYVDEPVAAAIGYGLSIRSERVVLIVDFGGGTLDFALVKITARDLEGGSCEVIAKEGRSIGGNLVDKWLLNAFCERMEYPLREDTGDERHAFWYRLMLNEACRVKEAVYFNPTAEFELAPPDDMRSFEARIRGDDTSLEVSREDIVQILTAEGLYDSLEECVEGLRLQAQKRNIGLEDIHDVLMVGGSTLLPNLYPFFEQKFGRDRVRAWQPFEAVAYGAAAFAAENFTHSDFIVHDYAFVTYDPKTHEPEYTVIIPKGTRFPTKDDFWKRRLVPTCSLGEPETMFKLRICEIGHADEGERRFVWDAAGHVHKLGGKNTPGGSEPVVVPLNESNPTLGYLKPPHPPSDRRPRLEISFGVNADRWLVATVIDLKTKKPLMQQETVVRLL